MRLSLGVCAWALGAVCAGGSVAWAQIGMPPDYFAVVRPSEHDVLRDPGVSVRVLLASGSAQAELDGDKITLEAAYGRNDPGYYTYVGYLAFHGYGPKTLHVTATASRTYEQDVHFFVIPADAPDADWDAAAAWDGGVPGVRDGSTSASELGGQPTREDASPPADGSGADADQGKDGDGCGCAIDRSKAPGGGTTAVALALLALLMRPRRRATGRPPA
jgi:MYXO-CTERM domain-containing protein